MIIVNKARHDNVFCYCYNILRYHYVTYHYCKTNNREQFPYFMHYLIPFMCSIEISIVT